MWTKELTDTRIVTSAARLAQLEPQQQAAYPVPQEPICSPRIILALNAMWMGISSRDLSVSNATPLAKLVRKQRQQIA